jgi:bidirectional [NiFe] hydrogenase diaphorase subunit
MSPVATVKTLKIDGRDVSGRQEETILDVARQNGIFIPRLCEMDGLSDVGACRLCLVELRDRTSCFPPALPWSKRGWRSRPAPSASTITGA